jgi:aerobic carbon-monoxide dehydrogenase large subunit
MVQGKWNITLKTPMGDKSGVLELQVNGDELSGSLSDGEHFAEISDGKIKGNHLSWSAKIIKPMRLTFKFNAQVEEDRISGSAKHLLGCATFAGTRA